MPRNCRSSSTYSVSSRVNVFLLEHGGDCHGARPAPEARALHQAVAQVLVDVLRAVRSDVDISRGELAQGVDGAFEGAYARSLERGEHFERKGRALVAGDEVCNFHWVWVAVRGRAVGMISRKDTQTCANPRPPRGEICRTGRCCRLGRGGGAPEACSPGKNKCSPRNSYRSPRIFYRSTCIFWDYTCFFRG